MNAAHITASIVDRLHDLGLKVHANDANTTEDIRQAIVARADRLSTNNVKDAVTVKSHSISGR